MKFGIILITLLPLFCVPSGKAAPDFSLVGFGSGTTGGAGGKTVTANTLEELIHYAESSDPLIIHVNKTISGGADGGVVQFKPNKSLIGIGANAFLQGVGLYLSKTKNIIIRNLKITMSTVTKTHTNDEKNQQVTANDGDCIRIVDSTNIWVDHCDIYNIDPAKVPNKDLYDGLIDITHNSDHITVSWNYFHDHHKCSLVGSSNSDTHDRKTTYHHNYFKNIGSRTPSYRGGTGHIYNNLFEHIIDSAINIRVKACVKVEHNVFDGVKHPIMETDHGNWDLSDNLFTNIKGIAESNSTCNATITYKYTSELTSSVAESVRAHAGVGKI